MLDFFKLSTILKHEQNLADEHDFCITFGGDLGDSNSKVRLQFDKHHFNLRSFFCLRISI